MFIGNKKPYVSSVQYNEGTVANRFSCGVNSVLIGKPVDGIVVAFRGTQTSNLLDWLQNAGLTQQSFPGFLGGVHGHSKGSALASLSAMMFQLDPSLPNVMSMTTFASVKFADSEFRNVCNTLIDQTSFENYLDIILFLLPSVSTIEVMDKEMLDDNLWSSKQKRKQKKKVEWDYQAVDRLLYIN